MISELISLALVCIVALLMLQHFGPWALLVNLVVALFALKVLGWLGIRVEINFWSLAIVILGGVVGLLLVLFLSITGIAFSKR
ncbi:MAG: hypothetical protein PHQ80_04250 [Candidatus ainarchaeum sp.]|nr:hypothetical protein [Candidatus ainarchaeum sp.]MDD5096647.1 hypothetical protein [Candidatus ainarchaeum sp.]